MAGIYIRTSVAALVLLIASSGATAQPRGNLNLFVSPAGEVYRPAGAEQPFATWFQRADGDGDGAISWDEFRADFARVFATLDIDGDGEIEPEEITRYETEVLPEMSATYGMGRRRERAAWDGTMAIPPAQSGRQGMVSAQPERRRVPAYSASLNGAARFGLLPIPHPIMEADGNFNRGVTREEWERAARRRFTALDSAHNGRLTATGLLQGRMDTIGGGDPSQRRRRGDPPRPQVEPGAGGTPLPRE